MARSGWSAEAVQRVLAQQASRAQRLAIADAVIDNGHGVSLDDLRRAVQAVWERWCGSDPVKQ
jgi:dephospho-CoA kinase